MRFTLNFVRTPIRGDSAFARLIPVFFSLVVLVCGTAAAAKESETEQRYYFEIPSLKVEDALNRVAQQARHQLLFSVELVEPLQSKAVVGEYTVQQALNSLLDGSNLSGRVTERGVILVVARKAIDAPEAEPEGADMKKSNKGIWAALVGLLSAPITATGVQAAEVEGRTAEKVGFIEEIVVTAERQTSTVQDTAIAISAFTDETMRDRHILNGYGLQLHTPGLNFGSNPTSSGANITIRGIGSETITAGGNAGVAVHENGAYVISSNYLVRDFFDVERIEVLRGPQGTLYGRNATGGAINVINKRPTENLFFTSALTIGNYQQRKLQAALSGPLVEDRILGRLSLSTEKRDGYTRNRSTIPTEKDADDSDYWSGRVQLEFRPTDNLNLLLSSYIFQDDAHGEPLVVLTPYPTDGISFIGFSDTGEPVIGNYYALLNAGPNPTAADPRTYATNFPKLRKDKAKGAALELNWDFSDLTLTALTAYHDTDISSTSDVDGSEEVSIADPVLGMATESFSQEVRLANAKGTAFDWVGGLYYYEATETFSLEQIIGGIPSSGIQDNFISAFPSVDIKSYAAFGQGTWHVNNQFDVTVGARYTDDWGRSHDNLFAPGFGVVDPVTGGAATFVQSKAWNKLDGKLGLKYQYSDNVMFYGTISTGYKAGGFSGGTVGEPAYDPEEVVSYELGIKSTLLDDRVQANLTAFYYDYTDLQVVLIELLGSSTTNAAESTVQGVEVEIMAAPSANLRLNATLGWVDATFDSFHSVDPLFPELGVQDLSGNPLNRSPELKYSFGVAYTRELGSLGSITARVDYSWIDEQFFRTFALSRDSQPDYHVTNARIWWQSADEHWRIDLWGANLEDDNVIANLTVSSPALSGAGKANLQPPRTYGLTVGYEY